MNLQLIMSICELWHEKHGKLLENFLTTSPLFGFQEKITWQEKCWEAKKHRSEIFKNNFIIQKS